MVKSRKNNLHLEVSNDVDLEYETASTTSRRSKKTNRKDRALTKTKKVSLKAKPKKNSSFLVVNGKKIPFANSKKSRRNKMSSKTKGAKKASSASKKRAVSAKRMVKKASAKKASSVGNKRAVASKSAKNRILKKKASPKSIKKTAKSSSALMKKRSASSKTSKAWILKKNAPRLSNSQKKLKTKSAAPATKKLLPSMDDIKEFLGVKQKTQPKSRPKPTSSAKKPLMPSANDKKVSFDVKEEKAQGSNSLQSSGTDSESAGSKTIYMPIKQEANGQTAEAIIVEDKQKAEADLQDVKIVEAEKKD